LISPILVRRGLPVCDSSSSVGVSVFFSSAAGAARRAKRTNDDDDAGEGAAAAGKKANAASLPEWVCAQILRRGFSSWTFFSKVSRNKTFLFIKMHLMVFCIF
jgi:hypothetical protein